MVYEWNLNNYCTFETFEINRLKSRSYFVSYPSKEETENINLLDYRYKSKKVRLLNGKWDFKFYENPNDFPKTVDLNEINFDKIDVPSCIQLKGYSKPIYSNVKYLFRLNPPHIPTLKPVGFRIIANNSEPSNWHVEFKNIKDSYNFVCVYRKEINIKDLNKDYTLRFYGVAPCFDLFINGKFVGYAEGSHEISEFYINDFINKGNNEIVLVVHRWCNESYLEDQDMFRHNGIFRDVCLLEEEKTRIWDFNFKAFKDKEYKFNLNVQVINPIDTKLHVKISYKDELIYEDTKDVDKEITISKELKKVHEWNAEEPNLYLLEIELFQNDKVLEYIKKYVGFKHVNIEKDIFLFNNQKIKFKGVNHHDSTPKGGYVMTPQEIELDIKLCKEYGCNAIRTSHYPPDPLLIELADYYGIYIVAEADIETHGCNPITSQSGSLLIANNLKWTKHFLDRVYRLYEPLKNNVSITMWSLGNECGGGKVHEEMYKYFKSVTDIPVHLESAIHHQRVHFDVCSMMYPSIELIHGVGSKTLKENDHNKKMMEVPFFMCEYAHAMGVGPGGLEEYFDEVYNYDSLMGGCIWEFCDHAIEHEDGPYKYTYGGDHGEDIHDGNFCADGLFYPDRTPSSGALYMKYVYRPIKFKLLGNEKLEVFNTNNFLDASNYKIRFDFIKNLELIKSKEIKLKTKPYTKEIIEVNELKDYLNDGDSFLNIYVEDKDGNIYKEQIELHQELLNVEFNDSPLIIENNNNELKIKFDKGHVTFNKFSGTISQYKLNDVEILKNNNQHNLMRAHLDNDAYDLMVWRPLGLTQLVYKIKNFNYEIKDNKVIIDVNIKADKRFAHYEFKDQYIVHGDGKIEVQYDLIKGNKIALPRFGFTYQFEDEFKNFEYVAREKESYVDFKKQSFVGHYLNNIEDMMEPNLMPQESGNRTDARYVDITNGQVGLKFIAVNEPFEFGAKEMSDEELEKMKHREDTHTIHNSYLTISKFNMGVGTGICGPKACPQYRLSGNIKHQFKYVIAPVIK